MKKVNQKSAKGKARKEEKGSMFWRKNILPAVIIFVTGLGLYASTYSFRYVLDDKMIITDNIFTNQGIAGVKKIFSEESFTGYFQQQQLLVAGSRYRPLSIASLALEKEYFQSPRDDGYYNLQKDNNGNQLTTGNPGISHILNAIFYALTGLLLFRILNMLFDPSKEEKWFLTLPFAATLIFITHPIHTEVIANIKSRDEIFALLFSLLSLFYLMRNQSQRRTRNIAYASFCFFLALLSKESAVSFLGIIPLTLYFFTKCDFKSSVRGTIPLFVVSFIYLIVRLSVIGHFMNSPDLSNLMNNPFYGMTLVKRIATIIFTFGKYLQLSFWPYPLTSDYYPYKIPVMSFGDLKTIYSLFAYSILAFIVIRGFRKKDPIAYCILLFLFALLPASNIFLPVGTFMSERFLYIASVGFCIAIAFLILEKIPGLFKANSANVKLLGIGFIIAYCVILSFITLNRLPAWKDNYTLFETDIVTSSNSAFSNCFMGVGLYQRFLQEPDETKKKEIIKRADYYERIALNIYPYYDEAMHNLSGIAVKEFEIDHDIDRLLSTFRDILQRKNLTAYIDTYLQYLNGQKLYDEKLIPFYHQLGHEYFYSKAQNNIKARRYIEMGLTIDRNNSTLNADLKDILAASGYQN